MGSEKWEADDRKWKVMERERDGGWIKAQDCAANYQAKNAS